MNYFDINFKSLDMTLSPFSPLLPAAKAHTRYAAGLWGKMEVDVLP